MTKTTKKIDELHDQLRAGVEQLTSEDDWKRALDVASRFHRYSWSNVLLILMQRPDATQVAGYRQWQGLNRQVRRGERGIGILAPRLRFVEDEETGERVRRLVGFLGVTVFDVSQTDGEPLPSVESLVQQLDGDAPERMWDALAEQVEAAGFTLERGTPILEGANGVTEWATKKVTVATGLSPAQAAKTLAHELAHVLMHQESSADGRGRKEVEAESVAYIICQAAGLDSAQYSFGYVAGWSAGKAQTVEETGARVMATAKKILDAIGVEAEAQEAA